MVRFPHDNIDSLRKRKEEKSISPSLIVQHMPMNCALPELRGSSMGVAFRAGPQTGAHGHFQAKSAYEPWEVEKRPTHHTTLCFLSEGTRGRLVNHTHMAIAAGATSACLPSLRRRRSGPVHQVRETLINIDDFLVVLVRGSRCVFTIAISQSFRG
jgi:hypothetical protein